MENTKSQPEIGPSQIPFTTFLLKILAGGVGGGLGGVILLVILVLASSVLTPLTEASAGDYISPVFVFILAIMIFIASTPANLLSSFLLSLTEREKYTRVKTAIYQIFILNVIVFLLMVPVYFLSAMGNISLMGYAAAFHIIVAAQISAIILEIVSDYKHSLVGIYGITFSIILSGVVFISLYFVNWTILLFLAIPVVWGSIAFIQSITTMIYGWLARTYDKDFLATDTVYGDDYGKSPEEIRPPEKKVKDEKGADFLRHN